MIKSSTPLETKYGDFIINFHDSSDGDCITMVKGNIADGSPLVRIHSSCLFSEALSSVDCDCKLQLEKAMAKIAKDGCGVIVYLYQEGRGHGLEMKVRSMGIENSQCVDTVEAFNILNLDLDPRNYGAAISALDDLKISKSIRLMSSNARKRNQLEQAGYYIKNIDLKYSTNSRVGRYLKTKNDKLGHSNKNARHTPVIICREWVKNDLIKLSDIVDRSIFESYAKSQSDTKIMTIEDRDRVVGFFTIKKKDELEACIENYYVKSFDKDIIDTNIVINSAVNYCNRLGLNSLSIKTDIGNYKGKKIVVNQNK